ncbi:MAG: FecR domain-containing protein [Pseudomonadota bacterium]|nr:FecR domain-containing protein [Pseudomonadota bacterium]
MRERLPGSLAARRWAGAAIALAAAAAVGWVITTGGLFAQASRAETKPAEIRELTLPDGSVVTVGAQSQVDHEFTAKQRRARLTDGDAFFVVSTEAARPFIVSVDDVRITAVGTRFEVRRRSEGVNVAVADGSVEVSWPDAEPVRLQAGEAVMVRKQTQPTVQSIAARDIGAWRQGRLVFDDATLGDLVSDANRYGTVRIVIEEPALAKERINTSFRVAQVEGVLQSLQAVLPVTVQRADNGDIVLRARR